MTQETKENDDAMDIDEEPSTGKKEIEGNKMSTSVAADMVEPSASGSEVSKHPDMGLAQLIHRLTVRSVLVEDLDKVNEEVLDKVCSEGGGMENPSLYRKLATTLGWTRWSEEELARKEAAHASTAASLEAAVTEAAESAGDMEVLEARRAVARFAAASLSAPQALKAYDDLLELPKLSAGAKVDALLEKARLASFYGMDAGPMLETAGKIGKTDWDRRNRLRVYQALHQIQRHRALDRAASLLREGIATFSGTELCTYVEFMSYTVLCNLLHLPRTELRRTIVDGPEVLSIKAEIPPVMYKLVHACYHCEYRTYLEAMMELEPYLLADRFLAPHAGYILRELHVLGYRQFLDSYRSVTLDSMASRFGVSPAYLDTQLSRFIAAGRLTAKIDKVAGVVETVRPDRKNAQYRKVISEGDALLNRIQKLARVVDL